ncbi:hypothetical protein PCO82_19560 [Pectobacteriaceae bacterium CE90]|nr:hypothetical protein PCO82_19560 [Pectobacteriaceae bacterium CE90]
MDINVLTRLFDKIYTLAINGTSVTESAAVLAAGHLSFGISRTDAAETLVRNESLKACGAGFACGLTGSTLLPLSVTADASSSLFIQMRMCAAVAIIGGHDTGDPMVRLLCWGALGGDACMDIITRTVTGYLSKTLSLTMAEKAIISVLPGELFIKDGSLLLKNTLLIPLIGSVMSGGGGYLLTRLTGRLAIGLFIHQAPPAFPLQPAWT